MKIVSGGQTGVDRAALDTALHHGISIGGWCPRGRLAEDGPISRRYPLIETPASDYAQRTERNVRDSDATLILTTGPLTGGTAFTAQCAEAMGKPCLVMQLETGGDIISWIRSHRVQCLNVAGPRESTAPGIYQRACAFLDNLFAALTAPHE